MNAMTAKMAYIVPAFIAMLGAIVAAYFKQAYIALGLIVVASICIIAGSIYVSSKFKKELTKK
jgi:hypothetical protein